MQGLDRVLVQLSAELLMKQLTVKPVAKSAPRFWVHMTKKTVNFHERLKITTLDKSQNRFGLCCCPS